MKELQLPDDFELSEAYLFFYDKLEKSNCYLENIILNRNADVTDPRLVRIMSGPMDDGGYWSYVANLVKKYGIVPKTIYAESFNSSVTDEMNQALTDKLAQFANEMRTSNLTDSQLRERVVRNMLPVIYQILSNFMGEPPGSDTEFDWEYHEAGEHAQQVRQMGTYRLVKGLTPVSFYKTYIEDNYDVSRMVILRNDPRSTMQYKEVYSCDLINSMVGGQPELTFNLCMEDIKRITAKTVMSGHPVWFACEVQRDFNVYYGLLAVEGYDYDSMLGLPMRQTKEESILTRNGGPSHAMAIVGLNVIGENQDGPIVDKWKIENSWGEFNVGDPGYLQMTDAWFDRYGYDVVVPIDMLPDNLREIYEERRLNPVMLPFNDPLGGL
jgi:bleomycin hydrolase